MATRTFTTDPGTGFSRTAARVSFATCAAFVALLAALHVLRPELDPSWRLISEYELGRYGWMMQLAFLLLAISCGAACLAVLAQVKHVPGFLGLALLVLSAGGITIAGIYVTDPITLPSGLQTAHGRLHLLGATLDGIPLAALFITWGLWRNRTWSSARRVLLWAAILQLIAVAVFDVSVPLLLHRSGGKFGPEVLVGWPNRLAVLGQCAWLMTLAWGAMKLPTRVVEPSTRQVHAV